MKKLKTEIWFERPTPGNAFSPMKSFLRGRNFYSDLVMNCSYPEMIFFTLSGRKPSRRDLKRLNLFLNACSNPGIRDEASRTAMNAAIGRGPLGSAVIAGLLTRTGRNRGSEWIEEVMQNMQKAFETKGDLKNFQNFSGLGLHFGSADSRAIDLLKIIEEKGYRGKFQDLLIDSSNEENPILLEGLIAAGFLDLGFSPEQGALLFLISPAASLFAFAEEQNRMGYKEYPNFFEKGAFTYHPLENSTGEAK
ncbi:MAG: hypothetical protein HQM08_13005 [Candidatus Riflebacteria bacterium]|nr:hypothetical protein [Candidatus Riflebacteria bacterium]